MRGDVTRFNASQTYVKKIPATTNDIKI